MIKTRNLSQMNIKNKIKDSIQDMVQWRKHIHENPETAYNEINTSNFISEKLKEFGIEVHQEIGKTGVVGIIQGKNTDSNKTVGIRADIDALPMTEKTNLPYASKNDGAMHACGHDGHTTMLLGAARHLAGHGDFSGRAVFIFQPAEEHGKGGPAMIADGLFDRFPVDAVYGMHNMPGMEVGHFALRTGEIMASEALFEIHIEGQG